MSAISTAYAPRVSAALRAAGFNPGHPSQIHRREGIYVRHGWAGTCSVTVAIDGPSAAARIAEDVAQALLAAGYTVEQHTDTAAILYVSRTSA